MWQKEQPHKISSFRESVKALESHIQHANKLAAALPKDNGGDSVRMKLSYGPFASLLLFLIEWMDYSCTDSVPSYLGLLHILVYKVYVDGMPIMTSEDRFATLREFYATIYPSLKQLEGDMAKLEEEYTVSIETQSTKTFRRENVEERSKLSVQDLRRDEECGICMDACTDVALPNCGHSMCITCFHEWNARSQSCPFCRGNLKRVGTEDLWVLTNRSEVLDIASLVKENIRCFYLYIENLPLIVPDSHLLPYEYLI